VVFLYFNHKVIYFSAQACVETDNYKRAIFILSKPQLQLKFELYHSVKMYVICLHVGIMS